MLFTNNCISFNKTSQWHKQKKDVYDTDEEKAHHLFPHSQRYLNNKCEKQLDIFSSFVSGLALRFQLTRMAVLNFALLYTHTHTHTHTHTCHSYTYSAPNGIWCHLSFLFFAFGCAEDTALIGVAWLAFDWPRFLPSCRSKRVLIASSPRSVSQNYLIFRNRKIFYYYSYYHFPCAFFRLAFARCLSLESEWQQVFRAPLSILTHFDRAVVWIVSILPGFQFLQLFPKTLETVQKASTTISTTVTFMYNRIFFRSLERAKYFSIFSLSLLILLFENIELNCM